MKQLLLMPGLLGLMGCASTQVIDSWKEPSVQGPIKFKQVVVMALTQDESARRIAEDTLASKIGQSATPSHTFIKSSELADAQKSKAAVQQQGADGLVTIRLI